MGQTITEKILAKHSGKDKVSPGEFIQCDLDFVLANDITAPIAIKEFAKIGVSDVYDKERIAFIPDHFTPNRDAKAAAQCKLMRKFSYEHRLTHYYEVGRGGVEHALLPEEGLVLPGDVVIGADSHTCTYGGLGAFSTGVGSTDLAVAMATGKVWLKIPATIRFEYKGKLGPWVGGKDLILYTIGEIGVDGALYKSMEFAGNAIGELSVEGRLTMANMTIEAGAKSGIIEPDDKTLEYVKKRGKRSFEVYESDEDADYERVVEFDVSQIEPQVAFPHLPSNTKPVSEAGNIKIDQVVIGSCTNGRIEDLRVAARVLQEKKADSKLRLIVIPATQAIYKQALEEGLIETFVSSGATVAAPTCGPCLGGHTGVLAAGEKAVATTNRNFIGRMGDPKSEVYLASPAVAAASAVIGKIGSPEDI